MRLWPALAAAAVVALAGLAAAVPGAAGGFTAVVQQHSTASLAPWFRCADAAAADASSAVFQWSLTETGATAADSSGRAFHGTYSGAHATATGAAGTCTRDGTRSWVVDGGPGYAYSPRMTQAFSSTSFTLEARILAPASAGSGGDVISACNSAAVACGMPRDDRMYLGSTGRLVFATYSAASQFQVLESATSLADGRWHHVAGTLSPAGMQLFIDGQDVTPTATAYQGSTASHPAGADPTTFTSTRAVQQAYWHVGGANGDNWPRWARTYFPGRIGWAAVYSTALPASSISAHWAAGR